MVSKRVYFRIDPIAPVLSNDRRQPGVVNDVFIFPAEPYLPAGPMQCEKNHIPQKLIRVIPKGHLRAAGIDLI